MDVQFFNHYLNLLRLSIRGTSTRSYHLFEDKVVEVDRNGHPLGFVELPPVAFYLAMNSHVSGRRGPVYPVMGKMMRDNKYPDSQIIHIDGDPDSPPLSEEEQSSAREALCELLRPVYFSVGLNVVLQPEDTVGSSLTVTVQERCTLSNGQVFVYERINKMNRSQATGSALLRHKLYTAPGVFSDYEGISIRFSDETDFTNTISEGENEELVLAVALDRVHQKVLGPLNEMRRRHEKERAHISAMQQAFLAQKKKDEEQLLMAIGS